MSEVSSTAAPADASNNASAASKEPTHRVLITGANGHLGQRLIPALANHHEVVAVVRSATAARSIGASVEALSATAAARVAIEQVEYTDANALRACAQGCDQVIHLAGILKESPWSSYQEAHEDTTAALLSALDGGDARRIQYLSIVGSHPDSANACLASKGRAEALLLADAVPALVLQVPMVLGEGDYAAAALNGQARRGLNVVFAAGARDQPLYAGDVVDALLAGFALPSDVNRRLTLAGPEAVDKRELINRAAALLNRRTRVIGLPRSGAILLARLLERLTKNPPVTVPMMDILHHDDNYDTAAACEALNLSLTSLDEMLEHVLRGA